MLRRHLIVVALTLSALVAADALSAQSGDDRIRVTVWFARLIVDSAVPRRPVVFHLPAAAPDKPAVDSLLRLLQPAFMRARLPITPHERKPGRDTMLVAISTPNVDSTVSGATFYTLFYSMKYCSADERQMEIYVVRVRCALQSCSFLSESPVGEAMPCREPR